MLDLNGVTLPAFPVADLEWVQDLENFDGPLLSLFKHSRRRDSYLFYWCDKDQEVNRWLVVRVSETNLIRLVHRLIPLDQIIPKGGQDDFVYFVDMDGSGESRTVRLVPAVAVPDQYMPNPGAFLTAEAAERLGSYAVIIERSLSIFDFREFFKWFSQAYAFVYNLVKLRSQRIRGHPWRGGFSAMHFWRELVDFVPVEDSPVVESMAYASPGYVRFKLDSGIATWVGRIVELYNGNHREIEGAASDLAAYFKVNKLNDDIPPSDSRWEAHNPIIWQLTKDLVDVLGLPAADEFLDAARRPFEAGKMAASFVRQIRRLADLEQNRLILFPSGGDPPAT